MQRTDGRAADQLRPMTFELDFQRQALASVLVGCGGTRILCAVSAVPGVPRWMRERHVAGGWITSEYQMLPASTGDRSVRELTRGRPAGRSQEIQRLIGRSLRAAVDLAAIGEQTFYVDCDVIDADGGTRCAGINGAVVALQLALRRLAARQQIDAIPVCEPVAAISVGIVEGEPLLDLCYREDAAAAVDMNVVMTGAGRFIEIQGTAESGTFTEAELATMTALARRGIAQIIDLQQAVLAQVSEATAGAT